MNRLVVALTLVAAFVSSTAFAQASLRSPNGRLCDNGVATYQGAAAKGDADAMFCMGVLHSNVGTGVARDDVQASRWFIRAADAGQSGGMYLAGIAFWSGRGVKEDKIEAYKWLDLSAKSGVQGAINSREGLTRVLSAQQIAEAKRRETEWEKDFQKRKKF